jgi:hypothetical protein
MKGIYLAWANYEARAQNFLQFHGLLALVPLDVDIDAVLKPIREDFKKLQDGVDMLCIDSGEVATVTSSIALLPGDLMSQ